MIDYKLSILRRLDLERQQLAREGEAIEQDESITRWRSADGSQHSVVYSSLTQKTADAIIDREIEHFHALGVGFEWKLYAHDTPPDLRSRLDAKGFEIGPCEAVLFYALAIKADWTYHPTSIEVRRVENANDVAVFRELAEQIFKKNYAFTARELTDALTVMPAQHRGYIAYAAGQPASIGRLYTHPQSHFGGLYGGGTLPAFRGRGIYRAVVAARAADARASGSRYLIVDALPTSQPILERMGFRHLTDTWPCDWRP